MTLQAYLTLAAMLFCIGLFGVITRRNTIGILLGIELMLNAVNINLVAFARFLGDVVRHGLHRVHHLHHGGGSGAGPGPRHPDLPRPPHRGGGPPGPAQGIATDSWPPPASSRSGPGWRPAVAFLLLSLVVPLRRSGKPAAWLSIVFSLGALVGAVTAWRATAPDMARRMLWDWIPVEDGVLTSVGVLVDADATRMLILVALVSLLVQVYSLGYLADEPPASLGRYYAFLSLFAFSMLGLVLAPNLLQLFVFWELVGLCSYLLIGFWYERPEAARAAVQGVLDDQGRATSASCSASCCC